MEDSGRAESAGAETAPLEQPEPEETPGDARAEAGRGDPPNRALLAVFTLLAIAFLVWTIRQTWMEAFPSY